MQFDLFCGFGFQVVDRNLLRRLQPDQIIIHLNSDYHIFHRQQLIRNSLESIVHQSQFLQNLVIEEQDVLALFLLGFGKETELAGADFDFLLSFEIEEQ